MSDIEDEFRSPWDEHPLKGDHIVFGIHYKDGSQVKRVECNDRKRVCSEFIIPNKIGSSAKSMGGRWLFKSTKLVIERYLQAVQCFKAVCLFDGEFCLVI